MVLLVEALRYKPDGHGLVSLEFFIDIILLATIWHLGLTQPLTEMSTRNISLRGKSSWCIGLTTLPCANCLETWEPQPPRTLRACTGIAYHFYLTTQ